ncbi:uncharacterized protein LOC113351392 [Papaver somniferum]|uniref:uncharacterized protein LOC113351392 n=1 Tax=Papaver somniferum TaxID=3469 RepID=UPI000E6FB95A|nr:uncharacterized protein LOC113351392 [Papaver somniferum]
MSCFVLPERVIKELNSKFKIFLWADPDLKKSYNPIKWSFACHSYEEGGLGIKDLENTNVAANLRHIWDLISSKDIIWTSWVKNFMEDEVRDVVKEISKTEFNISESDQIFWKSGATALLKRLKTKSKLCKWGTISDSTCILCGTDEESENHLFHKCQFSSEICKRLLLKMGIVKDLENSWDEEVNWCAQHFSSAKYVGMIKKLTLNSFVYHIWRERNNRVFRNQHGSQDQVSLMIIQDVRFKMLATKYKETDTSNARAFMRRWNIDCSFVIPEIILCTWLYPQRDEVMINTDGSRTDTAGGFGDIIRDHEAEVVAAASG